MPKAHGSLHKEPGERCGTRFVCPIARSYSLGPSHTGAQIASHEESRDADEELDRTPSASLDTPISTVCQPGASTDEHRPRRKYARTSFEYQVRGEGSRRLRGYPHLFFTPKVGQDTDRTEY